MATVAAMKKAAEKAQAREQYIKSAEIIFSGDIAVVRSQFDEGKRYTVRIAGMVATSCECPDHQYRGRHCKHCEAVEARLNATLPLFGTSEMDELITELRKDIKPAKKVRRSAKNEALVASLQVAEGTRVRKVRRQKAIRICLPVVVELSQECPVDVPLAA
jgi:SWIM zinc finger